MKLYQIKLIFVLFALLGLASMLNLSLFAKQIKYNPNNTKVLMVFNGEHYKEAENLLASIQKHAPSLVPLIVICVSDENGQQFAQRHNLEYFTMQTINESGNFMTRAMNIMTRRKFEGIAHLLEQDNDVLYIDTDIVVLANPFQAINLKYDLNIQNDQCRTPYDNSHLCTGFMFVQSNERTKKFFRQAIAKIENSKCKFDDQRALNWLVAKEKAQQQNKFDKITIKVLDACKFPNGCRYFDETDKSCSKKDAIIVHNNYLIGIDNKLNRFAEYGLMFCDFRNS